MSIRQDIIKRIENNDPEILGKLADLILIQEGSPEIDKIKYDLMMLRIKSLNEQMSKDMPKLNEVKFTTAELNKQIRNKVKDNERR